MWILMLKVKGCVKYVVLKIVGFFDRIQPKGFFNKDIFVACYAVLVLSDMWLPTRRRLFL